MCRAFTVLCVAGGREGLGELKRAAVGAEWELLSGATSEEEALRRLDEERPHVVVVAGPFEALVGEARARYPSLRIVTDRPMVGADEVVASLEEIRPAILGLPRPRGPVT